MRKVGIIGVGEYLPSKILTNADLEKMVDTSDEWITTRSGIKQRRLVAKGEAASDLAIKAAKGALKGARLKPHDLDLIIVATITPDMQFPSVACILQDALSAKDAICFDISAACAGFVYAIVIAQQFIAAGTCKNALVVGVEVLSTITDWQDRNTCVLFGDGAGAAVLAPVKSGGILSGYLGSDGSKKGLLMLPGGGSRNPTSQQTLNKRLHYLKMKGNELFKLAIMTMTKAAQQALKQAGLKCSDLDIIIPHQANVRILMAVAKKLGVSKDKVYMNIEKYGNMSSASTATALCEAVKEGRVKKGDIVLLDAFGAGLVWGACIIEW
ncbi:MAG: ketoacyl-ACP synthase III [Candidatus Omnitrophica bacterium]|nr:ketoacyl-ACP synthase III [Candidatus Omnitrophota bacterium]MBU4472923.1 ketoacyl-ACP synthase III [Candidatus Omnitrophota bacterium]MCG2706778.1 ketoacyl-ACP synthase III [Candidatus Omnitrophota bacterium]